MIFIMNKERRKNISNVASKIEKMNDELQSLLDEEQDYFDNIPENLQGSERAADAEMYIDILTEAVDLISEAIEKLTEV